MNRILAFIAITCIFLTSCYTATQAVKTDHLTIQYTPASIPWLASLYNCADNNLITTEQRSASFLDLTTANMVIRVGRPDILDTFSYQIGTEDLIIIVSLKNPTRILAPEQVRGLFTGQIQNWKVINGNDSPVQLMVFPNGEDIQEIFNQTVLEGSPVSSEAFLKTNPEEMIQSVEKDASAIGILTGRWKTGGITSVYTVAKNLPVLAFTLSKPRGTLSQILTCMQK